MKYILSIVLFLSVTANSQALFHAHNRGAASPYTADALAYIAAVEATGRTLSADEKSDIDRLIRDLKGESNPSYTTGIDFWSADKLYYLTLWGAGAANGINLRDPGTYTVTWVGAPTHHADGVQFSGANYGNTFFKPRDDMSGVDNIQLNSGHLSAYVTIPGSYAAYETLLGAEYGGTLRMIYRSDGNTLWEVNSLGELTGNYAGLGTAGFFAASRTSSTSYEGYKNGSQVFTKAKESSNQPVSYLLLGAETYTAAHDPANFSTSRFAFFSAGGGRTASEMAIFQNIINQFMTRRGINVY